MQLSDRTADNRAHMPEGAQRILKITDEVLTVKFNNEIRTPGRLAWHIAGAISELGHRMGLAFVEIDQDSPFPSTVKEIVDEYKRASDGLIKEIIEKWTDETLLVEDDMYGEMWKKGKTLGVLLTHQIHHRGQLTVVMRLAGLKVPGVYGPAKEEWANYGMQPQE